MTANDNSTMSPDHLDWRRAHERCEAVARRAATLDREIGRALLEADRACVYVYLGYGGIIEYGERLFGFAPKSTQERLRVAGALESLPLLDQALEAGRLCYSAARELTRVTVAETEAEWLSAAANKAVREIEDLVSGHVPGDRPGDEKRPEARRHVFRFEVAADVFALVRQAVGALRKIHGGQLDDEQALAMMARHVLGGPSDSGRASHQIVMTVCEQCGQGQQEGRGRMLPGCRSAVFLYVHHVQARADGGSHAAGNLATTCGAHHDAIHRGALVVEGDADGALVFRHADGTVYGGSPTATTQQQLADSFLALKSMGWKEHKARQAIDTVRPTWGRTNPSTRCCNDASRS